MRIRRILAATDFSDHARAALNHAAALARARDAELVVTYVFDPARYESEMGPAMPANVVKAKNELRMLLERSCLDLGPGLDASPVFLDGSPDTEIVEAARFLRADVVFVGAHGRTSLDTAPADSVTEIVITGGNLPTVVGRGPAGRGFQRILVGVDFSERSDPALTAALDVAQTPARIDLLHVVHVPMKGGHPVLFDEETLRAIEEKARDRGADLVARSARSGLDLHFDVVFGTPKEAILTASRAGRDLVALGAHAPLGLRRLPHGSLGQTIVRQAPCSVLVA